MTNSTLGLNDGRVSLAPHDGAWRSAFAAEAVRLRDLLGAQVLGIEHVGSTAIPGISAKPILDILVGLADLDVGPALAEDLATIGYELRPNAGLPEEHVFVKGAPRTHILHVVRLNGPAWQQKIAFRDSLRENPDLARSYEALKSALSAQFPDDRAAYTSGKADFVREVVLAKVPDAAFLTRP